MCVSQIMKKKDRVVDFYFKLNLGKNSLTAYFVASKFGDGLVVTRGMDLENVPLKKVPVYVGKDNWTSRRYAAERYWNLKKKDFPNSCVGFGEFMDVDLERYGTTTANLMRYSTTKNAYETYRKVFRFSLENPMDLHRLMSRVDYPFLEELKEVGDVFLFLHKKKFKKYNMEHALVAEALHPRRLEYYLSQGFSLEHVCDY